MDKLVYLFIAYTIVWSLIFLYTVQLNKRQSNITEELKLIKKWLEEKE